MPICGTQREFFYLLHRPREPICWREEGWAQDAHGTDRCPSEHNAADPDAADWQDAGLSSGKIPAGTCRVRIFSQPPAVTAPVQLFSQRAHRYFRRSTTLFVCLQDSAQLLPHRQKLWMQNSAASVTPSVRPNRMLPKARHQSPEPVCSVGSSAGTGKSCSGGSWRSIQAMSRLTIFSCWRGVSSTPIGTRYQRLRHLRQQQAQACCATKTGWPRIGV